MELNKQIKKYRMSMNLSQEELADKIYVSRQSISNWETGKNYPDIHSLLLMSLLFNVSVDQLIKGDVEIMKEEIKIEDSKKFSQYSIIFSVLLGSVMIFTAPLVIYLEWLGAAIALILFLITFLFSLKVEKFKKEKDIQTYKEILSFMNGEHLDEIDKQREAAKRPYQKFVYVLVCSIIAAIIAVLSVYFFSLFVS